MEKDLSTYRTSVYDMAWTLPFLARLSSLLDIKQKTAFLIRRFII